MENQELFKLRLWQIREPDCLESALFRDVSKFYVLILLKKNKEILSAEAEKNICFT